MGFPSYKDVDICVAMMETNRENWQRPDILNRLITSPDTTVVDLGTGTGYFTDLFSKCLPEGKIIALDPEISLISCLEDRKKKDSLNKVLGIQQSIEVGEVMIENLFFHKEGIMPACALDANMECEKKRLRIISLS